MIYWVATALIAAFTFLVIFAFPETAFSFPLSFYTNPWVDEVGYSHTYGAMADIPDGLIFYIFGKRIGRATWHWGHVRKLTLCDDNREVSE